MLRDGSERVEHLALKPGLHHQNVDVDFFALLEFAHRLAVVLLDEFVGEADGGFDEFLHGSRKQFVDVLVVVVIVTNAEDDVDVVPDGASKDEGVDARVRGHRAVSQVLGDAQLVVEQVGPVGVVEAVEHRKPVLLPGIVLDAE